MGGTKKEDCSGRYIEVARFPTEDQPGKGKYIIGKDVRSVFFFKGGEEGNGFDAKQANGRPFCLAPILECDKPVGFIWTMPEEYPKFEARFGMSEEAQELSKGRKPVWGKQTTFAKFHKKFDALKKQKEQKSPGLPPRKPTLQQAESKSAFGAWQRSFVTRRQDLMKIKIARKESEVSSTQG